jgi:hypothetical protein
MKDIRNGVMDAAHGQDAAMKMIASAVSTGMSRISDEISNLAGIVQGGFDALTWILEQQTQVLVSIDATLKTPSQTQAAEWRQMAEQLRARACFDEAEQWFRKSIDLSPLDFRTYVGFAMNYIQNSARTFTFSRGIRSCTMTEEEHSLAMITVFVSRKLRSRDNRLTCSVNMYPVFSLHSSSQF